MPIASSQPAVNVMDSSPSGGFFLASRLAVYEKTLIAGAGWVGGAVKKIGTTAPVQTYSFADTIDFDARAGHIAILGANRDAQNQWAPEQAIVWLGTVTGHVRDLHPLMYSTSTGVKTVAFCGNLDLGAVRFISDDEIVVVPGVEPGVFLYTTGGRLERTWQTAPLAFYDHCTIDNEEQLAIVNSEEGHTEWVDRHRVLDDVVSLPGVIGLILRSFESATAVWSMTLLPVNGGAAKTVKLPFTSHSHYTHIRADTRGSRMVFLFIEYGPHAGLPEQAPRIVVADYVH